MEELLGRLLEWVAANPVWSGVIVMLVALTESLAVVGMLVPGVVIMFGAGALVAAGAADFWVICAWAVVGAVVGDSLSYAFGRRYKSHLRDVWPFRRYPAMLSRGEHFFYRYGAISIAFARFFGPGRATVPLVAGMLDMRPGVFLAANVGSALLWAPAYLLPGVVLGASLELASEVAFGLVVLIAVLVALVWSTGWIAHRLFALVRPHAGYLLGRLLATGERFPRLRRMAEGIGNPNHPEARGLAAFAAWLFLGAGLLGLVSALLADSPPWAAADRLAARMLASLRSEGMDHLLHDLAVDPPFLFVLAAGALATLGLMATRRLTALQHWLANLAFLGVTLAALRTFDHRALPGTLTPDPGILTATVCWGMLTVIAAGALAERRRWAVYSTAVIFVVLTAFARLYLELANLGGIVTGTLLGIVWVAGIGVAYRTHALDEPIGVRGAGLMVVGFIVGGWLATLTTAPPPARVATVATESMTCVRWQNEGWRAMSLTRDDLRATSAQPLNVQFAGTLTWLDARLRAAGWQRTEVAGAAELLRSLSPSLPLERLPLLPHVHAGRHEAAAWLHTDGDKRLVFRLWSSTRIVDGLPLWIGAVSTQRKIQRFGLLTYAETTDAFSSALEELRDDLGAMGDVQLRRGPHGPVWLLAQGELDPEMRNAARGQPPDHSTGLHRRLRVREVPLAAI